MPEKLTGKADFRSGKSPPHQRPTPRRFDCLIVRRKQSKTERFAKRPVVIHF
jgi:hypothetical protein